MMNFATTKSKFWRIRTMIGDTICEHTIERTLCTSNYSKISVYLTSYSMFRKIPWYPNYSFDWNTNQVRSEKTGKILKLGLVWNKKGTRYHPAVCICNDQGKKVYLLGRLTLMIRNWEDRCNHHMHTCHNDDNPWNNKPSNVRLDTHRANKRDRSRINMQKILHI